MDFRKKIKDSIKNRLNKNKIYGAGGGGRSAPPPPQPQIVRQTTVVQSAQAGTNVPPRKPPKLVPPSKEGGRLFESVSSLSILDLVGEGPIEGFVNEDGTKAVGSEILSSIYYNNATIKEQQKRKLVTAELNNQLIGKTGYYESIVNDLESTSGVFEFLSTLPADLKDKKAKEIEDYRNELFDLNLSGNKAIGYIRFDLNGDINSVFANRQVKATNFSDVYLNAYFGSKENIYQRFIKTDEGETKELPENKFFGAILRDTNGNRITERGIMDQIYDVNGVTGFGYFFFWTNGRSLDECINGNPSNGNANNYDVFSIDSQEFKLQTTGSTIYPDIDEMINSGIGLSMIIDDPLNFNYLNTEIDFRLGEEDQRPLGDLSLGTRYFTVNQQILGPFRADGNAQKGEGNNDVRKGGNFATWQELLPPDENEFSYTHIIYQNEVENAIPTLAINSLRDTQAQARGGDEGEGVGRTLPQTLNIRVEYGFEGGDIPLGFEPIPANSRAIIEPSDYTLFYVKQARTENNLLERKYKLEFESGDAEFEGSYEFASNLNFARKITIDEENSSEYAKSFVGIYNFFEETEREIVYGKIKLAPDNRFDIYYFLIFDKNTRKWSAVDANFFSKSESICAEAEERQIISLTAPEGYTFTSVDFASYGTPNGECGNYSIGACHSINSKTIIEGYLLGQTGTVEIPVNNNIFGDPCQGTVKRLYLETTVTNSYEPNNYGVYSAFVENPSFNLDNSIDALDGLSMSGIDLEVSGGQVIVNFNPFKDIKNIKVEDFRSVLYAELNDPDHMIIYNKSEKEWVAYDEGRTGEASFVGTLPTTLRQNFEFLDSQSFEPSYSGANPPQNMSVDVLLGLFPEIVQGDFSNLKLRPTGEGASLVDVTPDTELTQFGITSGDIGAPFYCVKDFDIIQPGFGYRNKEDLNLKINNEYLLKPEIENAISISNGKVVKNNNAFSAGLVRNAFIDFDSQIISQDDIFFERGAGRNFSFGTELANLDEATGENGKVTISYLELAATGDSYENLFKRETSEVVFDGNQPVPSTSFEQVEKYETNRSAIVTQPFSLEGDSNGYSMAFVGWLRLDEGTPQQTIADIQTTSEINRIFGNKKYKLNLSDPEISGFLKADLFKLNLGIFDNVNYDETYEKYSGVYKLRRDQDNIISFAQIKNSDRRINFNKNNQTVSLVDFSQTPPLVENTTKSDFYSVNGIGNGFDGFYYKSNITEENDFAQEVVFAKENDVSRKIIGKISGDASIGSASGEEITLDTKITIPYMQLAGTGSGYFELFSGRIFDGNQTIETPLNSLEEYDVERPAIITNEITTRDFYNIGNQNYSIGFASWLSIDPDSPKQVIASIDSEDELLRKESLQKYRISGSDLSFQDETNFDIFEIENLAESIESGFIQDVIETIDPLEGGELETIIESGEEYRIRTFRNSEDLIIKSEVDIEYLIVAGGGGGGNGDDAGGGGGGGGAGGVISSNGTVTQSAGTYQIIVGQGGQGSPAGSSNDGENGENSSAFGQIAIGGGGGGMRSAGLDGGSGGGASRSNLGGSGTSGQGNDGGSGQGDSFSATAGGGGGAGQVGEDGGSPSANEGDGDGGDGLPSDIAGIIDIDLSSNTQPIISNGLFGKKYKGYFSDNVNFFTEDKLDGDVDQNRTRLSYFTSDEENYGWQWLGYFVPKSSGIWTFYTSSDDASYLWIGSNAISGFSTSNALVDNGGRHQFIEKSGQVSLTAGVFYAIRIQYGENTGADAISVSFAGPGVSKTTDGNGFFYNGKELWNVVIDGTNSRHYAGGGGGGYSGNGSNGIGGIGGGGSGGSSVNDPGINGQENTGGGGGGASIGDYNGSGNGFGGGNGGSGIVIIKYKSSQDIKKRFDYSVFQGQYRTISSEENFYFPDSRGFFKTNDFSKSIIIFDDKYDPSIALVDFNNEQKILESCKPLLYDVNLKSFSFSPGQRRSDDAYVYNKWDGIYTEYFTTEKQRTFAKIAERNFARFENFGKIQIFFNRELQENNDKIIWFAADYTAEGINRASTDALTETPNEISGEILKIGEITGLAGAPSDPILFSSPLTKNSIKTSPILTGSQTIDAENIRESLNRVELTDLDGETEAFNAQELNASSYPDIAITGTKVALTENTIDENNLDEKAFQYIYFNVKSLTFQSYNELNEWYESNNKTPDISDPRFQNILRLLFHHTGVFVETINFGTSSNEDIIDVFDVKNPPTINKTDKITKDLKSSTWEIAGEFYDKELETEVIQWSTDGTTTGNYFVEFAPQQNKWYLLDKNNQFEKVLATAENSSQNITEIDNWKNETNDKNNIKLFYDAGNASRNIKNSHMSWLYDDTSGTFNLVLQKSDITGDTLEKLDSAFGPKYNLNEIQNEIIFDQITGLDDGKFHFAAIGIEIEQSDVRASLYIDNKKSQTINLNNNHINNYSNLNGDEFLDFLKNSHFADESQKNNVKLSVLSPYDNKFNSNVKLTNYFVFAFDDDESQISGGLFKTDAEGDFEIWKTSSKLFKDSEQYKNAISALNVTQINSDKGVYNAGSAGIGWIPDSYYRFSSRGTMEPVLNLQNDQIKLSELPGLIIQGQEDTINVDINNQIGELNLSSLIETKWVAVEYSDAEGNNPSKTETIISKTDGTEELFRPLSLVNLENALDGINTEEFGLLDIKKEGIDVNLISNDLSNSTVVSEVFTKLFDLNYKITNKAGDYNLNVEKIKPSWRNGLNDFGYKIAGILFDRENRVNVNYWTGEYEVNGNKENTSDWMSFNPSTNTFNLYDADLDNTILLQGIGNINNPTGSFYWFNNANDTVLSGKSIFTEESSSREINNTSISWIINDQGKNALSVQQNSVTDSQADKYFGPKFDANNAIEIDFDQSPDMRDGNFHFVVVGLEYNGSSMNGKLFIDKKRENNNTFPDNSGEYTKSIAISDIGGNDNTNFVVGNFRNSNNARLNIFSPYDGEFNSVAKLTNYLGFFNSSTEVQIKSGLFDINNRSGNLDAEGGDFEIFDNFGNLFDNTNQKALISMFDMNPQKGVFNETTNSFIEDSRDYFINQGTQEIAIKQKNEPMEPKRLPGIITENLINIAGLATAQSGGFEIPQELEENIPSEVFIEDLNISTAYGDAFGDLDRRWLVGYDQGIAPRDIALGLITFYEDYTFEGISDGTYLTELETNFDQEIPNNELLRNYTYGNAQAPLSILEAEGLKSTDRIFPGETWRDVNRYIKVRKMDFETESILIGRSASVFSISEYYSSRFKYPFSAMVSSTIDARTFERAPKRRYEMRFKKIKIPSNYFPLNGDGSDKRFIRLEDPKKKVYVGEWDGSFRIGWSDNPAWILYDLLTNTRYGVGTQIDDLEDIDIFELYQIGKYCDAVDDEGRFVGVVDSIGRLEPRFSCNVQLERKKNAFEIISNIAAIFRGLTYWSGGSFNFAIDKPKEIMAIFNNGNVYEGGFSYGDVTSQSRFSRVSVSYKDKYDDYKNKIEYVDDEEQIRKYGILENEHFALGSTSRSQARRVGKYILISNKIETETVTFQTGSEALLLAPGDIIKVDDELKNFEINYGKIKRLDPANNTITFKNYINSDSIKTGGGSGIYIYNGKGQKSIKSLYDVAKYEENSKFSDQEINETKTAQISKFIVSNVFEDTINKEITVEVFSEIGETLEEYMKGYDFNIQLNNDVNQLYRVIKVTQQEPSLYQVEALQHSPDKFEQIEREDYSIKENKYNIGVPANIVDRPSPPQNGSITIQNNIYGTFDAVITFDNPPDVNKIDHYLIAVDYPDTQYVTQQVKPSETGTTTAFIRELDIVGEYFVRIKSVKNPESSKEERMTFFVPAPEKIKNNFTIEKVSIFSPKERTIKNTSYLNNSKQKVRFNLEMTNLRGEEFNFKDDQSVSVDIYLMKGERKILMKENHRSNSFEVDILKQLPKGKKLQRKEHLRFRLYRKQNKAQDVHNVILKNNKCKIKNLEIFGNKFLIEQDEASMEIKKIEVYVTSENFTGRQKTITVQDGSNIIVEMNEAIDLKNNKYTLVPYDIIGKGEEYKINHSE